MTCFNFFFSIASDSSTTNHRSLPHRLLFRREFLNEPFSLTTLDAKRRLQKHLARRRKVQVARVRALLVPWPPVAWFGHGLVRAGVGRRICVQREFCVQRDAASGA
jgi:hypothetical protein